MTKVYELYEKISITYNTIFEQYEMAYSTVERGIVFHLVLLQNKFRLDDTKAEAIRIVKTMSKDNLRSFTLSI